MMECTTKDCDNLPNFRYTWPGKDEAYICLLCVGKLNQIAEALGMHQQFIPLIADDYMRLMERKVE